MKFLLIFITEVSGVRFIVYTTKCAPFVLWVMCNVRFLGQVRANSFLVYQYELHRKSEDMSLEF